MLVYRRCVPMSCCDKLPLDRAGPGVPHTVPMTQLKNIFLGGYPSGTCRPMPWPTAVSLINVAVAREAIG